MVNDYREKLKIEVLLGGRVCFESNTESSQSHRVDTPADSDAYRCLEASREERGNEIPILGRFGDCTFLHIGTKAS